MSRIPVRTRRGREQAPRLPLGEAPLRPSFRRERAAIKRGVFPVAGCDEVGRGPLAGPVVAAAVILDPKRIPRGLDDSKKLTAVQREKLYARICATAEVGVRRTLSENPASVLLLGLLACPRDPEIQMRIRGIRRQLDHRAEILHGLAALAQPHLDHCQSGATHLCDSARWERRFKFLLCLRKTLFTGQNHGIALACIIP